MKRGLARWGPFAVVASAPVLFTIWLVAGYELVVPLFDHWLLLDLYDGLRSGELGPAALFVPHNGLHVAAVSKAILGAMAFASGWSFELEAWVDVAMLAITTAALLRLALRAPFGRHQAIRIASLLTCFVVWTPAQHWAWIWTIGFFHYFGNLCVVLALWALAQRDRRLTSIRFAIALALGIAASFNRFEGSFAWWILLPCLIHFSASNPLRRRYLAIWCSVALCCTAICGWLILGHRAIAPAPTSIPLLGPSQLLSIVLHLASFLGIALTRFVESLTTLGPRSTMHFPMGLLLISSGATFAWLGLRSSRDDVRGQALVWVTLGGHAGIFAAAVALGRTAGPSDGGFVEMFISMYVTTTSLFTAAIFQLAALVVIDRPRRGAVRLAGAAASAAAMLIAANYAVLGPELIDERAETSAQRHCYDVIHQLAPLNTCFWGGPNPVNRELYLTRPERMGFRRARTDLIKIDEPIATAGALTDVFRRDDGQWWVSGWAAIEGFGMPDAILLGNEGRRASFFAIAQRTERTDGRVQWRARVAPILVRGRRERVQAWRFDATPGRFVPLTGVVDLED